MEIKYQSLLAKLTIFILAYISSGSVAASFIPKRSFPLSHTIEPCQNFFEYVCSETNRTFEIPEGGIRYLYSLNDANRNNMMI